MCKKHLCVECGKQEATCYKVHTTYKTRVDRLCDECFKKLYYRCADDPRICDCCLKQFDADDEPIRLRRGNGTTYVCSLECAKKLCGYKEGQYESSAQ